jgi:hypothetical protein
LISQGSHDTAINYAHVLQALADPSRLLVFWLLAHIDERICVAEGTCMNASPGFTTINIGLDETYEVPDALLTGG